MIRSLSPTSALDPTWSLWLVSAAIAVVVGVLSGLALSGAAVWKVRPADPAAGWLLGAAGIVQAVAIVVVGPLVFAMTGPLLEPFGSDQSLFMWLLLLPACRAVVLLSLAFLAVDALVVASSMRLVARR